LQPFFYSTVNTLYIPVQHCHLSDIPLTSLILSNAVYHE